ncbi:GNAT family N-acetyltransferase [Paenibacillus sp. HB172176]|uniref:GNAT family N-acetyltransferase n=1 Tax=Paenibacillus sp. HB172176 TaxID=2493690 RepID=UPI00143C0BD4|nr:GNAT family N-acetyltransferase [Paenibacillus sp. HB172176]
MNISIQEVDQRNWFDCTKLKVSEENGKRFIVPIVYSIAESRFEKHLKTIAIYKDDKVIGFSVYCIDKDDGQYWIYVYMIDADYQGKGYGKEGLIRLLEYIKTKENGITEIIIGHKPDNEKAGYLYQSIGFKETGQNINGEIIRKYKY